MEVAAAWADISHALRGFYELADVLIVLDKVLSLEISNLARQLKFKRETNNGHYVVKPMTTSLWFRNMELTLVGSTSSSKWSVHDQRNVVYTAKQLELMVYRFTQERRSWLYLTSRLEKGKAKKCGKAKKWQESVGNKMKETAPPLIKQVLEIIVNLLEQLQKNGLTVGRHDHQPFLKGSSHRRFENKESA